MLTVIAVLILWSVWSVFLPTVSAAFEAERGMLAKGQYQEAIGRLETTVSRTPLQREAAALLLEARLETGDYRRALEQGQEWLKTAADAGIAERTAEAAYWVGEYDRATALIEPYSSLRADWLKGTLAATRGQKEAARTAFDRVVTQGTRRALTPEEKGIVAAALVELGRFKEANDLYRDATRGAPENSRLKSDWGLLMLEKHNPGDAEGLFREALEANPNETRALVGLAAQAAGRFESKTPEPLTKALAVNPNLAEARLLVAQIHLEAEDYKAAGEQLDAALKVNPQLADAWALRAVEQYLQGNPAAEQETIPRILRQNPAYGKVYAELGDFLVIRRQYGKAVEFYRRAVETDPDLADARSDLGINLFRLGEEAEARKTLEEAYKLDPYNVWTVNTLRLMDSFVRFEAFETAKFRGKLHQKESVLLRPYVEELLETALGNQIGRYHYAPPQKVVFEMYPDHEDFAVRTLGLPGLGALGASFGPVVAMDSPSARPPGAFHWGSTLWHELAHVITLGITDNRVPRWFTEGLSTYEENTARPGWGDQLGPEIIGPLKQRGLIPMEKLNGVFVRPEYPAQIGFAYFQSGLICEFIAERFGFPKILMMLASYKKGTDDAAAIREALGLSLTDFDAQFRAYAREKTYGFAEAVNLEWANPEKSLEEVRAEIARNPNNFFGRLRLAADLEKQSQFDEAIAQAQAAKKLFPPYTDDGDPYRFLAGIYEKQGQKDKAAAELLEWRTQKGRDPETFHKLATLLQELGRTPEAIRTLEESLQISMYDLETHQRLGEWYMGSNNARAAAREYQAVLSLDPPDKAEAHYRLATAYRAMADNEKARRQVLAALEIAPGFRPAQRLLLELSGR